MANPPIYLPAGWPKVTAADYDRLLPYLVWPSSSTTTPASPVRGQTRMRDDNSFAFEVYYGATTGWARPWNQPWGEVSFTTRSADSLGVAGVTYSDLPSLTTSPSNIAGRKWRITAQAHLRQRTSAGLVTLGLNINAAIVREAVMSRATDEYVSLPLEWDYVTDGTARVIKLQGKTSANTIDLYGAPISTLAVTDVGPSGSAPTS